VAFVVPLVAVGLWEGNVADLLRGDYPLITALVGGGSLIVALGVWDDLLGARAIFKLASSCARPASRSTASRSRSWGCSSSAGCRSP
jgi:hypothetical protein